MAKSILLLFSLYPMLVFGQEIKKINDKNKKEVYYALKSDKTIRQGNYEKFGWDGKLLIDGFYKNGLKDSIWTFYYSSGQVAQKYDYTKKMLILENDQNISKHQKMKIRQGSDSILVILDKNPDYIGGFNLLHQLIFDLLEYPPTAKDSNIMGTVYVKFTVDTNGKAIDFKILKGVAPSLNREAMRVAKELPDDWIPGILNGKKVDVPFVLPLSFKLR